jgi:hypothetical protein
MAMDISTEQKRNITFPDNVYQASGYSNNFIENDTILVTKPNMEIMLNDPEHPFGHGYCLALALLNWEEEFI